MEPCGMKEIKAYKPSTNSISEGQVLSCPYTYDKARIIVMEMADSLVFSADELPDRCPECGAVAHDNKKAVRPASKTEIEELLKIQKEDKEETQNEST
jgi:hypothetical protein